MKVTMAHFRTVPGFNPQGGFCARGGRLWAKKHGLDWGAFVRDGIDEEVLLATGDGFAKAAVAHAHATAKTTEGTGRG